MLDSLTKGKGSLHTLDQLQLLVQNFKNSALYGLGQSVPNPVLSTMLYFEEEYRIHVEDNKCLTVICKELLNTASLQIFALNVQHAVQNALWAVSLAIPKKSILLI